MSKKEVQKKKTPYKPQPYKDGNTVVKLYDEPFTDQMGNKAMITKCDFLDKKQKLTEGYVLHVKWIPEELQFVGEKKKAFLDAYDTPDDSLAHTYYDGYLMYFFSFEGKKYMSYFWDENSGINLTYMVFELKDSLDIPKADIENLPFGDSFEEILNYLVDNKCINNYIVVKHFRYQDTKIVENNTARLIFNVMFEKYCNRKVEYILD